MTTGIAAPKPSPVKNRAAMSVARPVANIVEREARPNRVTPPTSTGLRPNRSARRPPKVAERKTPTALAVRNNPSWRGSR
jgi:hypothetical protein